jgi:uncharacterized Tic20 family protein
MTSNPVFSQEQPGGQLRDREVSTAATSYLGAIFLGPVIPLVVYALRARRSPFVRYHVVTALNISLTVTLYVVCCLILGGLLLLDSVAAALIVVTPIAFVIWLVMLRYLLRGVAAASRDEHFEVPDWICARLVRD